ncbi:ATPdependent DNA helicase [Phytophthora palmivora]|uniref:ATPdependent DNA helicase n=1 Tax=Phytophthora palmivora TaxID=4796 RepID=A0A2P4WY58_9STRA|nr:ATPdependent DNA helicase [Phytophthora palmivora]
MAFHAGMDPEAKEKVRTGFARGRVRVVVATVAFGMGIDKKNWRVTYSRLDVLVVMGSQHEHSSIC